MTRLLDGRHHLERFTMEQAGEVDYLITRTPLTPCSPQPRSARTHPAVMIAAEHRYPGPLTF